jgi:hypothetical protein
LPRHFVESRLTYFGHNISVLGNLDSVVDDEPNVTGSVYFMSYSPAYIGAYLNFFQHILCVSFCIFVLFVILCNFHAYITKCTCSVVNFDLQ